MTPWRISALIILQACAVVWLPRGEVADARRAWHDGRLHDALAILVHQQATVPTPEGEQLLAIVRADLEAIEELKSRRRVYGTELTELRAAIAKTPCAGEAEASRILVLARALGLRDGASATLEETAEACGKTGRRREAAALNAMLQASQERSREQKEERQQRTQRLLDEADDRYHHGDVLGAILVLEDSPLGGSSEAVREKLRAWGPQRTRLVETYMACGETSLSRERPDDAYECYRTVLRLDPRHGLARDRMRMLEVLRQLQRGG